jgi:LmbE family N-acetylglucosaminyl deacetylase
MDEHGTLIVAAHPDDETIGAGIRMTRHKRRESIMIAHLTAGSPRDLSNARAAGCATAAEYACVRPGAVHEEFASYHAGRQGVVNGEFLAAGPAERALILTEAERDLKAAMFAAFHTQRHILKLFPLDPEQYERFGFGIGIEWRRHAAEALA